MSELFTVYLIVCPLVFLGGFVDSIAGGGGFISLPAYMIAGLPVHMSIGTNKLSSAMGTSVATYRFAKNGFINFKTAIYCLVCALIGSFGGARVALLLTDRYFKLMMLVILPLTAIYVFFNKSLERTKNKEGTEEGEEDFSHKKTILIAMPIALVIGFYDGFYGPGTGTFLMIALTSIAHMTLNESAGITKVINLTTNVTSLCVYLLNGKVLLSVGLVAGLFGIAGNYIGANLFSDKGVKIVKPLILVVLTIFFFKVLLEVM